jgi:hypothetical protein
MDGLDSRNETIPHNTNAATKSNAANLKALLVLVGVLVQVALTL